MTFDIIGDVHGCFDELTDLLAKLGYTLTVEGDVFSLVAPEGRRLVFVGDLVDRGLASPAGVEMRRQARQIQTRAFCVPGNHDVRLMRVLRGKDTPLTYMGSGETLEQLASETPESKRNIAGLHPQPRQPLCS